MTTKWFDDPLIAAYIAREYGVEIDTLRNGEQIHMGSSVEILLNFAKYKQRKKPKNDTAIYQVSFDSHEVLDGIPEKEKDALKTLGMWPMPEE